MGGKKCVIIKEKNRNLLIVYLAAQSAEQAYYDTHNAHRDEKV